MLPDGLLPDNDYYLSQTPDNDPTDNVTGTILTAIIGLILCCPVLIFIGYFLYYSMCATG